MGRFPSTGHQKKKKQALERVSAFLGDPYGNRTHVTAVKGPCLNLLTNGPEKNVEAEVGFDIW